MKRRKMYLSYILLGLILVQYQNCAQPENNWETTRINSEQESDGTVGVINPIQAGEIFFPEKTMNAASMETSEVVGMCEQSGAIISWTLRNTDGHLIERGSASCDRGSFAVELSPNFDSQCEGDLQLKAALGAKASSEVTIITNCNI